MKQHKNNRKKIILLPYSAHDHCNRHKVHIQDAGEEVGALCGFHSGYYGSTMPFLGGAIIDEDWLSQPDPDHVICLHCKKIATKKLKKAVTERLNELVDISEERLKNCDLTFLPNHTAIDFLSESEKEEMYQLKKKLPSLGEEKLAAQIRIQKRIEERKTNGKDMV